jgi:uncharacterized protein YaeQ
LPRLAALANLAVIGLDPELLQGLVARLERGIDWSLTISGGALYLTVADTTLTAPLEMLQSAAS